MPKVTVIITLYNQGEYLKDAFNSLNAQTFKDWECVIVDDGSKDDSLEIAQRLVADNFRYKVVTKPNSGVAGARNFGIQQARGEYLSYLDSDDWLYPSALHALNDLLDTDESIGFASCQVQESDNQLNPCGKPTERHRHLIESEVTCNLLNQDPLARVLWNNPTKPGAEIWRTERICHLKYDESLKINEDWDTLLRHILTGGRTAAALDVVVKYRRHTGSLIDTNKSNIWFYECFRKNFLGRKDLGLYADAAELAALISMIDQPEDDPCWSVLNRGVSEYLKIAREVLKHPTLSRFATLWLGGSIRRIQLPPNHRYHTLLAGIHKHLAARPFTYWVATRRLLERVIL